jgi:polyisoprenoid-binding protein YceI
VPAQAATEPATQPVATGTSAATGAAPAAQATTAATTAATAAATTASSGSENTTSEGGQVAVFQIDPSQSQAQFTLNEVLMGRPNTVKGSTSKVTGAISVTLDNPANTQIGTIQIDASDLHTDSGMRDRMIQRFILQAQQAQYQYIYFQPTAVQGMPAKLSTGDSVPIKITGNLKIRDVVKPVTFDTTVTMKSDTELDGSAKATVNRSDFNLKIPSVNTVADVTDQVALELQFVATKQ